MRFGAFGAAMLAAGLVAGCSAPDPDDRVVARVMGEAVTAGQVDAELLGASAAQLKDPAVRRAALEAIVTRKLLAKAARAEGLDRRPEVLRARATAKDEFDSNLFRSAVRASVPIPTAAEVSAYMTANPQRFAARRIYLVEELRTAHGADKALVDALLPTKSLAAAEAVLTSRGVPYRKVLGSMDTLQILPQVSQAVADLPPGEPFIVPDRGALIIGAVRGVKAQPLTGAEGEAVAGRMLLEERRAAALARAVQALRKDTVVYADAQAAK